jgi:hypothetical protein
MESATEHGAAMTNSKQLQTKKKRWYAIPVIICVLILLQIGLWRFFGKKNLDDHVFLASIKEITDTAAAYHHGDYPDYFFIDTDLETSLSSATMNQARAHFQRFGITPLFRKDLTPETTIPGEGTTSSRMDLEIIQNTPLLAQVKLYDGHGPLYIAMEYFGTDTYLYLLGKWFRIRRTLQ